MDISRRHKLLKLNELKNKLTEQFTNLDIDIYQMYEKKTQLIDVISSTSDELLEDSQLKIMESYKNILTIRIRNVNQEIEVLRKELRGLENE